MTRLAKKPECDRYALKAEIVRLSVAADWDDAKSEWTLADVYRTDPDEPGTCLCGHSPILEHCVIQNQENGNTAVVGSVCVNKFLGIDSDKIFTAIRRIAGDLSRAVNAETIDFAHERGWINDWERNFYTDTLRRRKLTAKQRATREKLNRQILYWSSRTRSDVSW
jgi:hypothetical protein